ncbi:branched-chain amino acid ABC transporter permease [Geminicoccus roseus]|uniref:branched-chain amino acid ABC transporter permease n=1 Tax=Geminicoccus roseus TaxID=404900 RepID=UPI0003FBC061|nr:branched-chain amino acid ABC transporter permease [Geminicoccus roseus]
MTKRIALAALLLLLLAVPAFAGSSMTFLTIVYAKALAVLGILLLLQAGQVSFGHGMFFAAGAYTAAFLGDAWRGADMVVLLVAAALVSILAGLIVGLFVTRYRGIFFGMLNLAFSMVLFAVLEKFFHLTGGSDGMRIRRPTLLGFSFDRGSFDLVIYYTVLVLAVLMAAMVWQFLRSPLGQALKAMKANETRLEYIGISAKHVMLVSYVFSALLCGLGGVAMGLVQGIATPDYTFWTRSSEFVFIAVLGGAGHVLGAFAGSFVYEAVRVYAAAFLADSWQLILGAVLIVVILWAPGGLIDLHRRLPWARRREAAARDEARAVENVT